MKKSLIKKLNEKNIIMQAITCMVIVVIVAASLAAVKTGYGTNLQNYLGVEVFDFSQDELTKFSDTWFYDEVNQYFVLQKKVSTHKYNLNKEMRAWKCLCITIDKMSSASTEGIIVYYDKEGAIIAEQPVTFQLGENTIVLYGDIEMYRMGIRIKAEPESIISIASMQLRSELYAMDKDAFVKIFIILTMFGYILAFLLIYKSNKKEKSQRFFFRKLFCAINYEVQTYIIGKKTRNTKYKGRSVWRRTIFSILFLWVIWGDFSGIATDKKYYQWFALLCTVLLMTLGGLCIEKKTRNRIWDSPASAAWMALWVLVIISDIIVGEGIKFTGYIMLLAGGFFICCWNQMKKPICVVHEAMTAMQIDFFIVIICCIFFRKKRISVYYHGMFHDAESFAVYSLLMYVIFLTEIYWELRRRKISRSMLVYITGTAVSLFMAIRSGTAAIWIVIGIISTLYLMIMARYMWKIAIINKMLHIREIIILVTAIGVAFLVTLGIHISIKCVPEILRTDVTIENETWISSFSTDELALYQSAFPDQFVDLKSQDTLNIRTIQKNYLRKLGATGSVEPVKVYGKKVQAYNGYLEMAYRYGTFTLIPFILFQIYVITESVRNKNIFLLSVNIIYVFSCVTGNMTIQLQHPIVWWMYLMNGNYFFESKKSR